MTQFPHVNPLSDLILRLQDEADLCRNEGASDIAALLDKAMKRHNAEVRQPQGRSDL